jgi:hypothetical protein
MLGRPKRKTPAGFPARVAEFLHPPIVAYANDGGALVDGSTHAEQPQALIADDELPVRER